nr:YcaO-like family protein [Streptomyces chartreusis]
MNATGEAEAGIQRAVHPRDTWARVAPLLPAMGITRVADLTGLDSVGIPVFQAIRPNGRTLSVSQGKGVTAELAKVSAVMESIETWHAEESVLLSIESTVAEMAPQLPYSVFNLPQPPRSVLSPNTRLNWVVGRPIGGGNPVWLPHACVRMDNTDPNGWSPPLLCSNSNGLASGNTIQEALLHGMYEVLERDARARIDEIGRKDLVVDLSTVVGTSLDLLDRFFAAEVRVRVHDLTSAAGVPCYEALIWSADLPVRFAGWGCHLRADVALSRALTEAAQSRLTMIAGSRDDVAQDVYDWATSRSRLKCPFPSATQEQSFPTPATGTQSLEEDLQVVADTIRNRATGGVYWIDLTREELALPVVKVVAPGLRLVKEYR